jgi:hypothetical protein
MSKDAARDMARRQFWADLDKQSYRCPDCGRSSHELRTGFEVHHKDGNPENNEIGNLIALCRPCHNIREEKKPSLNEIKLMRDQLAGADGAGKSWAFVRTEKEAGAHFTACDSKCEPTMQINAIKRRKYAELEIDFITTRGWKKFVKKPENESVALETSKDDLNILEYTAQLTEDATEAVNSIMYKYRDKEFGSNYITAPSTAYKANFIAYPPMRPDACRELANELEPIVMDENNWEPSISSTHDVLTYTKFLAEYGSA